MTLLIKNASLYAQRRISARTDIFIRDRKIQALGNFPRKRFDRIIDAQGALLIPGFIDSGAEIDHHLAIFRRPQLEEMLRQGITTAVIGLGGASLAPLLYGDLGMFKEWNAAQINVDWRSLGELWSVLMKRGSGINLLTAVGQTTIKDAILRGAKRNITVNEAAVIENMVRRSRAEGSLGVSFGQMDDAATRDREINIFSRGLQPGDIIFLEMRAAELGSRLAGLKKLSRRSQLKIVITGLVPESGRIGEYENILESLGELPDESEIYFTANPAPERFFSLARMLPPWARRSGFPRIDKEWLMDKIAKDMEIPDPEAITIFSAPRAPFLSGHSLKTVAKHYGLKDHRRAFLGLLEMCGPDTVFKVPVARSDLTKLACRHPRALIASESTGHSGQRNSFQEFISYCPDLAEAVSKLTEFPAKIFNCANLGRIKEGCSADLVVLKDKKVATTIVGGRLVYSAENGIAPIRAGQPLHPHAL